MCPSPPFNPLTPTLCSQVLANTAAIEAEFKGAAVVAGVPAWDHEGPIHQLPQVEMRQHQAPRFTLVAATARL